MSSKEEQKQDMIDNDGQDKTRLRGYGHWRCQGASNQNLRHLLPALDRFHMRTAESHQRGAEGQKITKKDPPYQNNRGSSGNCQVVPRPLHDS